MLRTELTPIQILLDWLEQEKQSGAQNPNNAILATATKDAIPHTRVVAIREINLDGLLFFTQRVTRKVEEIKDNPTVSLNFWLELKQRQTVIEGIVETLTLEENSRYWQSYARSAQIRFLAYAPTSAQPISSLDIIESKRSNFEKLYEGVEIPLSPDYVGFRIKPSTFTFYEYRTPELSDVNQYKKVDNVWVRQLLSP